MTDEFLKTLAAVSSDLTKAVHPAAQKRLFVISGELIKHMRAERSSRLVMVKTPSNKDLLTTEMASRILSKCAGLKLRRMEIARRCSISPEGGRYREVLRALIRAGKIKKSGKLLYEFPAS